jgi:hypothetical protein
MFFSCSSTVSVAQRLSRWIPQRLKVSGQVEFTGSNNVEVQHVGGRIAETAQQIPARVANRQLTSIDFSQLGSRGPLATNSQAAHVQQKQLAREAKHAAAAATQLKTIAKGAKVQ